MEESKSLESSLSHAEIHAPDLSKAEPIPVPEGVVPLAGSIDSDPPVEDDYEYVTGFKLATVIGCVTLVAFLILLDQSIIATVRYVPQAFNNPTQISHRQFHVLLVTFILFLMLAGMVALTSSQGLFAQSILPFLYLTGI